MKIENPLARSADGLAAFSLWFVAALALGGLAGGCAAPSVGSSAPKPGRGLAEYREVTRSAHRAVSVTVKSLEGLALPPTQTSVPPRALAGFDRALSQLELTSVKARARAEAIIGRGQVYFEEWKENLSTTTNQTAVQAETERYARLLDHFQRVRERSGDVRGEFGPFMGKLREFRAALDRVPSDVSSPASQGQLAGLTASGRRVLQTLESVSTALDQAEAELKTMLAAKR